MKQSFEQLLRDFFGLSRPMQGRTSLSMKSRTFKRTFSTSGANEKSIKANFSLL